MGEPARVVETSQVAVSITAVWGSVYGRTALLLSCAAALVLLAAGVTGWMSLAGIGLIAAGFYAGRVMVRRHAAALACAERDANGEMARLTGLCAQSASLWVRQIETVRDQADAEVAQLARFFGEIARKLDDVMGTSRLIRPAGADGQEELLGVLARNGRELGSLVTALHLLQASKERIVQEIGSEAARLKDNAAEIRQIALHIRMVSLNATIEAARAGPAGKPFAVIVSDMRELAARTAEASGMFSRHTDRLHSMVGAAFQEQAQTDSRVVSIAGAEELVKKVVASSETMMRQLTQVISAMEDERSELREDISQVLVSLQFQDRASQILSHVSRNLEEMQARMREGRWDAMGEGQWMEHMATPYSTHEEFANQREAPVATVHPGSAVTFF